MTLSGFDHFDYSCVVYTVLVVAHMFSLKSTQKKRRNLPKKKRDQSTILAHTFYGCTQLFREENLLHH